MAKKELELNEDAASFLRDTPKYYYWRAHRKPPIHNWVVGPLDQIDILDIEGQIVVTVPADIHPDMLKIIFAYGERQFNLGETHGIEKAQTRIRVALGMQE